jgi:hypothetical protein
MVILRFTFLTAPEENEVKPAAIPATFSCTESPLTPPSTFAVSGSSASTRSKFGSYPYWPDASVVVLKVSPLTVAVTDVPAGAGEPLMVTSPYSAIGGCGTASTPIGADTISIMKKSVMNLNIFR